MKFANVVERAIVVMETMLRTWRSLWQKVTLLLESNPHSAALLASFSRTPLLWSLACCVAAFLIWATMFTLDVASYAQGQVTPAGQLKRIQHLEGGIIRNIAVAEGQQVAAGAVIAELEDVVSDADTGDLRSRVASMEVKTLRITASLNKTATLVLPPELESEFPEFARDARLAFDSYRSRYDAIVQTHNSKAAQRRAEIQDARERLRGLSSRSKYVTEQVKISEEMLKQRLTHDYEHLQLKKEQAQIEAEYLSTVANERRAMTALDEEIAALAAFRHEEDVALRRELQEASTELASLRERLRKPNDSRERTVVRAPVAGSILTLYFKNKGGVVSPGGTIATLVPEGEALLIEAKLPIADVGYVHIDSPARLTLASGAGGFSSIMAKVVHISPDTVVDEKATGPHAGTAHYVVRLQPAENAFRRGEEVYALRPGVQVTAAILTGERSVLSVLLEPFIGSGVRPLTER